jgi:flagellar protein FlaG
MLVQPVSMASASGNRADLPPRPAPAAPASTAAGRQESPAPAAAPPAAPPPSREAVHAAVEAWRKALGPAQGMIEFRIDESTGRTVVQVLDPATEEVLRQIPSEEMLAIARALDRVQGLLLSQQA